MLTGAWQRPKERRLLLLFANVSDQPVSATLRFDGKAHGIHARTLRCSVTKTIGVSSETRKLPVIFAERIDFPPRSVEAWELSW